MLLAVIVYIHSDITLTSSVDGGAGLTTLGTTSSLCSPKLASCLPMLRAGFTEVTSYETITYVLWLIMNRIAND